MKKIILNYCLKEFFALKATTDDLCMLILDSIKTIYLNDQCNYFILESQNLLLYSLDDSNIKIHTKSNEIQVNYLFFG